MHLSEGKSRHEHKDLFVRLIRHGWARQVLKVLAAYGPLRCSGILRKSPIQ
jgi:hypothetical protein